MLLLNQLSQEQLIWGLLIGAALIIFASSKSKKKSKKNEDGKIKDEFVTRSIVLEKLKGFKPELNKKLKSGYTEKSIQKQLDKYLKEYFQHVNMEYVLGGINASKMDIDIGEGKVGIELKLADKVYKSNAFNTLTGQLREYNKSIYGDDNLIVGIIGDKEHKKQTSQIKKLKELIDEYNGKYVFLEVLAKGELASAEMEEIKPKEKQSHRQKRYNT